MTTDDYNTLVPLEHRQRYGQFFTPPAVARFMVEWVLESGVPTLYDPAHGLGALNPQSHSQRSNVAFSASELDPLILEHARFDTGDITLHHEDYLQSWGRSHANIVCNPPYRRFQKFEGRERIFRQFHDHLGLQLAGHTNTASAFLLKSLAELDGSGRLAYLMPLEFLNAGYGKLVKRQLLRNGQLVAIISLRCEQEIFPDAITTVGLILVDSTQHHDSVGFFQIDDPQLLQHFPSLTPVSVIPGAELDPDSKWLPHFQHSPLAIDTSRLVPLEYYGRFRRGIATGANDFFVLTPAQARALGVDADEVQPCITRNNQVQQGILTDDDVRRLQERDAPVLLFTAGVPPSTAAQRYLKQGEAKGYHQRFLTRHRKPWYRTEQREAAPLWLGVFSRGNYKVVLNRSGALNLTSFHGFQPTLFGQRYLEALFLYLLSSAGRRVMALSLRQYGDGLDKFEPNDLNAALVPAPSSFDELAPVELDAALRHIADSGTLPPSLETFFASLTATPHDNQVTTTIKP